jgi:glycine/D-amino acid oxidase-like deaminating enzyme
VLADANHYLEDKILRRFTPQNDSRYSVVKSGIISVTRQPYPTIPIAENPMLSPELLLAMGAGASVLAAPGIGGALFGAKGFETDEDRAESLWTSKAPPMAPAAVFEGERAVDLAIIGGGYTGLSCAYYARKFKPDWTVVVLESHCLGSGASSRNSGAVYAKYWGHAGEDMPQRGLDRLRSFIDQEGIGCHFRPSPTIEVFGSKWSAARARASLEEGARWIPVEELAEDARSDYYAGAVELPGYYTVDPAKLVAGHVAAARRVGAELFENSPVLEVKRGTPVELVTPAGRVYARKVFIATNAFTPRLGFFRGSMVPIHQFTFATRRLTEEEIGRFGLKRWPLRFERRTIPVTNFLTPGGHFCIRIVLGYAGFNSCCWQDIEDARTKARKMFERRYPWIADVELTHGWHGVTGHTIRVREISGPVVSENIHVGVAFNGLGIMPGHNTGYLTACQMCGHPDEDIRFVSGKTFRVPIPGEYYRSLIFKPFIGMMNSV